MRFLQRHTDQQTRPSAGDGDNDSNAALDQARSEADRLLAAGDEAIRRALGNSNSEAFLRSARQQGGE